MHLCALRAYGAGIANGTCVCVFVCQILHTHTHTHIHTHTHKHLARVEPPIDRLYSKRRSVSAM